MLKEFARIAGAIAVFHLLAYITIVLLSGCSSSSKKPQPVRPDLPGAGQAQYCLDWLAAQHKLFNLGAALEELPDYKKHCVGTLDGSFGDSLEPIHLILGSGKVNHYRVHLTNGAGLRNGQLAPYEIGHGHSVASFSASVVAGDQLILQPFIERVKLYCDLMEKYPGVRFYLSPMLEHNLTVQAYNTLAGTMWGHCTREDYYTVNNPVGGHPFPHNPMPDGVRWIAYEDHHASFNSNAHINSLDGATLEHVDVQAWKNNVANSNVGLAFGWLWGYNCRVPGPFIDPRSRTACPSREEHRAAIKKILSGSGKAGPVEVNESWGSGNLWKPVSEGDGNPVVLIRNHYTQEFDSCKAKLKSGAWDNLRCVKGEWNGFRCTSNPDRLTYRANHKCNQYAAPEVICKRGDFTLNLKGGNNACQRQD